MEIKKPETIYLGFEKKPVLYLREGFFTDKILITPSHKEYPKLVGFLVEDYAVTFKETDIEYKYLRDLFLKLSKEGE